MTRACRWLLIGLLVFPLVISGCSRQESSDASPPGGSVAGSPVSLQVGTNVGQLAPMMRLPTLSGDAADLASLRGKVVMVNFWATWCGPCLVEMPSMQRLYNEYQSQDFEILAVSSDFEGEPVVKPYVDRLQLTFPILLDPRFEVNQSFKVTGIPTTIIIDRDGIITHKFFGSRDWDTLDSHRLIMQLLKSRA